METLSKRAPSGLNSGKTSLPAISTISESIRDEAAVIGGNAAESAINPSVAHATTSIGRTDQRTATSLRI
jgi:hypothetical protein